MKQGGAGKRAASQTAAILSNPFETRTNKRLHQNVLGKRVKGAERNVAVARSRGFERREKSLGAEIAAAGKQNSFIDRRFGEDDPSVDVETRNLVRLQKERLRQLKASKKKRRFQLGADGDGGGSDDGGGRDVLTHFGRSLAEDGLDGPYAGDGGDSDDSGSDAAREATAAHFGGGSGSRSGNAEDNSKMPAWRGKAQVPAWAADGVAEERPRSYKEIMEEVIAKSKAARAERARDKIEQESMLERLDQQASAVAALLRSSGATVKQRDLATGGKGSMSPAEATAMLAALTAGGGSSEPTAVPDASSASVPPPPSVDEYDTLVLSLAQASRAASARERTWTDAEAAEHERTRLAELEALRVERMIGSGSGGPVDAGGRLPLPSGDDLGPTLTSTLTMRQRRRVAAGASILDLYGKKDAKAEDAESNEASEDDDSDSGSDDDGDDGSEAEEGDEGVDSTGDSDGGVAADGSDLHLNDVPLQHVDRAVPRATSSTKPRAVMSSAPPEMPFVLECPTDHASLDALLATYAAPLAAVRVNPTVNIRKRQRDGTSDAVHAVDDSATAGTGATAARAAMAEALRRVRACSAISLGATGNKARLLALYSALLDDIIATGDAVATTTEPFAAWRFEAAFDTLFAMSQEAPLARDAGLLWKARVAAIGARVGAAMAEGAVGARCDSPAAVVPGTRSASALPLVSSRAWLTGGELLLVRAAAGLFPSTDLRHVVVTSLGLLLAQQLANAPISNETDVARGVATAAALVDLGVGARRFNPELLGFLQSTLGLFATVAAAADHGGVSAATTIRALRLAPAAPNASILAGAIVAARSDGGPAWAAKLPPLLAAAIAGGMVARSDGTAAEDDARGVPLSVVGVDLAGGTDMTAQRYQRPQHTRGSLARRVLLSTVRLLRRLAEEWAPHDFVASATASDAVTHTGSVAERAMAAAVAPNGDAARILLSAVGAGGVGGAMPILAVLPSVPFPCVPEMLDPCIAALAAVVAGCQDAAARASLAPSPDAAAAASAARLAAVLKGALIGIVPTRDAIARARGPLRLMDRAGPPPPFDRTRRSWRTSMRPVREPLRLQREQMAELPQRRPPPLSARRCERCRSSAGARCVARCANFDWTDSLSYAPLTRRITSVTRSARSASTCCAPSLRRRRRTSSSSRGRGVSGVHVSARRSMLAPPKETDSLPVGR